MLSFGLTLKAKKIVGYGQHLRFPGKLVPALRGKRISLYTAEGRRAARGRTSRNGSFHIGVPVRRPGTYDARFRGAVSNPVAVRVRPSHSAGFLGSGVVGRPLQLIVRLRPAAAGSVRVDVRRRGRLVIAGQYASGARIRLPSGRVAEYRITLSTAASADYATRRLTLRKIVFYPRLGLGSAGPSVLALNEALHRLHIAVHGYPFVPFYPGSHGCVRVPVWLAPRIYGYDPPGSTIYIY